jgi:hypothetical protein
MSFLNKLILIVISFILLISLVFNFILYRGLNISIDKSITNHQEQYQQQYQGQMSINQFYVNGDSIEINSL